MPVKCIPEGFDEIKLVREKDGGLYRWLQQVVQSGR